MIVKICLTYVQLVLLLILIFTSFILSRWLVRIDIAANLSVISDSAGST
jgi:hypothetical protein